MVTNPMVLLPMIGLVAGIGVLVMTMLELGRERAEAQTEERTQAAPTIARPGDKRTRRLDQALAASPALRRAVEVTADLAQRRGALGSVERMLRAADVPVRPAEMILLNMFAAVVVPILALLLTGSPFKTILAFFLAAFGPILTLRFAAKRRTKKFNAQLPDALTTLAGSLRAGRPLHCQPCLDQRTQATVKASHGSPLRGLGVSLRFIEPPCLHRIRALSSAGRERILALPPRRDRCDRHT